MSRCSPTTCRSSREIGRRGEGRGAGFQKKYGAFLLERDEREGSGPSSFARRFNDRHPMAYHVKRAEFDDLLLEALHATAVPRSGKRRPSPGSSSRKAGAVGVRARPRRRRRVRGAREGRRGRLGTGGSSLPNAGDAAVRREVEAGRAVRSLRGDPLARGTPGGGHPPADRPGESGTGSSPFPTGPASVGAVFEPSLARESGSRPVSEARRLG